jgi:hypothetical protein
MNILSYKKLIYLICGILILSTLGAYAVESGNRAASSQIKIVSPGGRAGGAVSPSNMPIKFLYDIISRS